MRKETKNLHSALIKESMLDAFWMMTPQVQIKNPVMFVTYVGAFVSTLFTLIDFYRGFPSWFEAQISLWMFFTVYFANFAQSIAEGRGRAQAASLRKAMGVQDARQIVNGKETRVSTGLLRQGDIVVCEAGDMIPADGEVIEGVASVDESAITGESAPVIRESGGDRSAVTGGTIVLSDKVKIQITNEIGKSFIDRMIELIEGAKRKKTPNEMSLHILLSFLTIVFLVVVFSLIFMSEYSEKAEGHLMSVPVLMALIVCLIPTTISALISAIGIAGMDRLVRKNVIAKSGRSVEAAGDIDLLILDKTGTITMGNRMAYEFIPFGKVSEKEFAEIAQAASLSDETPEGRSIVVLSKNRFGLRGEGIDITSVKYIPFSAKSRMSGVDMLDSHQKVVRRIRKGAADAMKKHVESIGGFFPHELSASIEKIAQSGGTPLVVSDQDQIVGVVHLKDVVKGGIKERFEELRKMGIQTVMVTGDNSLTAAAIAAEAGVDDYLAQATPEMKLDLIKKEQERGRLVAMAGDGTNDAPALAQADVAVAMNTGTQTSREAGNMVDLDSNPTKLLEIVEVGKQLLMTRGALTTFSIANDVAKYFAIIPAIFAGLYMAPGDKTGPLAVLNVMFLHSHKSAILSAVIFNALIIIALIPVAIRGVSYRPGPADVMLRNNILVFGLGGILIPFAGIKVIDELVVLLGLA